MTDNNGGSVIPNAIISLGTVNQSAANQIATIYAAGTAGAYMFAPPAIIIHENNYRFGDIVRHIRTGAEYIVLHDANPSPGPALGPVITLSPDGVVYRWWAGEIERIA